ncbi:MAG: HAD-IIIC family phosphatase [Desulfobacteraceae bacterium]|nr:MAG: HAD-IIIC family phosphatase [Desulfobacteraceae bacterium]
MNPTCRDAKGTKTKCVVWDLDNTLWNGVLLEGPVTLNQDVIHMIRILDQRGILNSIASKNDFDHAVHQLKEFGIEPFFLYPQIHWGPKSSSLKKIAEQINIGLDTLAFIDDQPFELDEVESVHPQVLTIPISQKNRLLDMPEMNPEFITADSKSRRLMYLHDMERKKAEECFDGPAESFLASLKMKFTISKADKEDLKRAEELTVRTNQLNTTGYTYSYDELEYYRTSEDHILLIAGLEDKYGTYGKIGLVLIECKPDAWLIKLLLMSCRVLSRGVGNILIAHIRNEAKKNKAALRAEMISTDRNRMMYMTYKFNGFSEIRTDGAFTLFENDLNQIPAYPAYVDIRVEL